MKISKNYNLEKINAFKVKVKAKYFAALSKESDLNDLFKNTSIRKEKIFILGDGTNTLFTKDFDGLIIKNEIKGIKIVKEKNDAVVVELGAGENWHKFTQYAINKGWAGVENLSLIPGTVGAAPVQNIAAYGQNFEDVFESLTAVNLTSGKEKVFTKGECQFGYRESVFKKDLKGKYIITKVRLKLSKQGRTDFSYHSRYDSLIEELSKFAKPPYSLSDISKAVIAIRERKFPNWKGVGTAGSFFLNPVITKKKLAELQKKFPELQYYPVDKLNYPMTNDPKFDHDNHVKIPAGWLLEELGWKGKKIGSVSTSSAQALVVINNGGATAKEILSFAEKIQKDFYKNFKINLEPEVNII